MSIPPTTPLVPGESDDASLHAGRLIFKRYRLEKFVGRGGMGVVWRGFDTRLERVVALKFLPEALYADVAARDDLKRETRRSLELTHPHIVRIYDFMEDQAAAAISMEYMDGATLAQRRIDLPERHFECEALHGWVYALCLALDYAHHTACVVHRDLKPGNLMVNARGVLKVTDFGIACSLQNTLSRVTSAHTTGGTLGYMSPQQLLGELPAPGDDIYSLGATLYELLTGKPPFHSGDLNYQIREIVPESIAERRRKLGLSGRPIDPLWEETIRACLAKSPADRPGDAMEIARRLGLSPSGLVELTPAECPPTETPAPGGAPTASPPPRVPASAWATRGLQSLTTLCQTARPCLARHRAKLATVLLALLFLAAWFRPRGHEGPASLPASSAQAEAPAPTSLPPPSETPAPPTAFPALPPEIETGQAARDRDFLTSPAAAPPEKPSVSESPAPAGTAKLQITTVPAGIPYRLLKGAPDSTDPEVLATGTSPALAENLPSGDFRVEMTAAGLGGYSFGVHLDEGAVTPLERSFPHGTVKIQSTPAGAEIYCDDVLLGTAPLEAPVLPGEHQFHAESGNEESPPKTLTVTTNITQALTFNFHSAGNLPRHAHHRVQKAEPSTLSKIGKSISNFFTGGSSSHH